MFTVFWLNYQVGLQTTDYCAPHPFLKIYVSNMPQKHLNLSIPHPQNYPSLSLSLRVAQTCPHKKIPFSSNPHTPLSPSKKKRINKENHQVRPCTLVGVVEGGYIQKFPRLQY